MAKNCPVRKKSVMPDATYSACSPGLSTTLQGSPVHSRAFQDSFANILAISPRALQGSPGLSRTLQGSVWLIYLYFMNIFYRALQGSQELSMAIQDSPGLFYQYIYFLKLSQGSPRLSTSFLSNFFDHINPQSV